MTNSTKTPPLLPEETLHRVLRAATLDGWSVLGIAGVLALGSAAAGDFLGTAVGLLVAAAGAIELHGAGLLRAGDGRGMKWVVASQPYLLAIILGYCALSLWGYDQARVHAAFVEVTRLFGMSATDLDAWRASLAQTGKTEAGELKKAFVFTYATVAGVTLLYQGRMAYFYLQRQAAVLVALEMGVTLDDAD